MRDRLNFKWSLLSLLFLLGGCAHSVVDTQPARQLPLPLPSLQIVPGQLPFPQSIKSVEFYRKGFPGNPPVIRLGTSDKLFLRFDELSSVSGQFRVTITHFNKNWEPSPLDDIWFLDGVNDFVINGGTLNRFALPSYFQYEFEFPKRESQLLVSGNYMLHIFDFQSGIELFSLPFYVTEDEGEFEPYSETVFNSGSFGAAGHQLLGTYFYPKFVLFPQFELSYQVVQNRFLNQPKSPNQINVVKDGEASFWFTRDQLFPAYFDFNFLELSPLTQQNPRIFEYRYDLIPERATLFADFLNFSTVSNNGQQNGLGQPSPGRDAKYADVHFQFEAGGSIPSNSEVYLIGDFNQWTVDSKYRLTYNPESTRFEVNALIKEGSYSYKYVTVENGEINTLYLSEILTSQPQEYMAFVYYRDPQLQYDRLLNVKLFYSE